ncbi:MAG TPA: hypothetical protein PK626_00385 [Bacteroidales bacterium]|nr:hypothetical protein [Bacteroidales bacterium]
MKEQLNNAIIIVVAIIFIFFGFALFFSLIKSCIDEEKMVVKHISGYDVVELEDGHWYLRGNRNALDHYIECPKCNKKE